MTKEVRRISRRQILSGMAVFGVGAAAGGAVLANADGSDGSGGSNTQPSGRSRLSLTLRSDRLVSSVPGRVAGELRPAGKAPATRGDVFDTGGSHVGQFSSAAVPGAAGALMLHTFELADGTILGMGSGPLSEATYAVVGGTGRFQGAAGSYVARQHPRDLGGDGSAEFVLDLMTEGD